MTLVVTNLGKRVIIPVTLIAFLLFGTGEKHIPCFYLLKIKRMLKS